MIKDARLKTRGEYTPHWHIRPVQFCTHVAITTAALVVLWVFVALPALEGRHPLLWFMAFGALLMLASLAYGPTCLDLTLWSMAIMTLFPLGLIVFIGSPGAYALWTAFIDPFIEVSIK